MRVYISTLKKCKLYVKHINPSTQSIFPSHTFLEWALKVQGAVATASWILEPVQYVASSHHTKDHQPHPNISYLRKSTSQNGAVQSFNAGPPLVRHMMYHTPDEGALRSSKTLHYTVLRRDPSLLKTAWMKLILGVLANIYTLSVHLSAHTS